MREDLLDTLTALLPSQLDEVVVRAAAPAHHLPTATAAQRALALVQWARQSPEHSAALESALRATTGGAVRLARPGHGAEGPPRDAVTRQQALIERIARDRETLAGMKADAAASFDVAYERLQLWAPGVETWLRDEIGESTAERFGARAGEFEYAFDGCDALLEAVQADIAGAPSKYTVRPVQRTERPPRAPKEGPKAASESESGSRAIGGTPWALLQAGIAAVPAVRYALGVAGVAAALALFTGLFASAAAAAAGVVVMLGLMVLLLLFTVLVGLAPEHLVAPAKVFTWSVLLLTQVSGVLLASSIFFDVPKPYSELVAPLVGRSEPSPAPPPTLQATVTEPPTTRPTSTLCPPTTFADRTLYPADLPTEFRAAVPPRESLSHALAGRGCLVLDGATLVVGEPGSDAELTLVANTITLRNRGRLITNGSRLRLQVLRLVVESGGIASFIGDEPPSEAAPGSPGRPGLPGGVVVLTGTTAIEGALEVRLPGQRGGLGGDGRAGARGAQGARGSNGVDGVLNCRSGGGDGERGGNGLRGEDGYAGGRGGDGGSLILADTAPEVLDHVKFTAPGGPGGEGGRGGPGGPGGPGGEGGSGSAFCKGGHGGPAGSDGPPGRNGSDGQRGDDGKGPKMTQGGA